MSARAISQDPYQSFAYRVKIGDAIYGAFVTAGIPEITLDVVEYQTGTMKRKQKYPGNISYGNITLTRGMCKNNSAFYDFVMRAWTGETYREDIEIQQLHRTGTVKIYKLYSAFGVRCKLGSDLDANSADMSIEEIEIAFEDIDIEEHDEAGFAYKPLMTESDTIITSPGVRPMPVVPEPKGPHHQFSYEA